MGIAGVVTLGIMTLTAVALFSAPKPPAGTPPSDATLTTAPVQGDAARGKTLYGQFNCGGCHVINGVGNAVGPDLSHVGANREATYLKNKTVNPKFDNPESIMPPTEAPPKDIDDLVAYMASLK